MLWLNEGKELHWTCWPKLSMILEAIGFDNFRMWWWLFELQCMKGQVAHPSFLFLAQKITSLWYSVPFAKTTQQSWRASLCSKKYVDMQRVHEATRLHLQAARFRRNALYNSKLHRPRYQPVDNVWYHISVIPEKLSPNLSSPWKGPYATVQCLNDEKYKIKNTPNQEEPIAYCDCLKHFVQHPEELQLPRRRPRLPRVPESKLAQKPLFAIHQHCNCSQNLYEPFPPSPRPRSASPAPIPAVFVPETPIHGYSAAILKRASSLPSRTTLCSPPQDLSQVPSQAQSLTVIIDTSDLSKFSRNLSVPPVLLFSPLSIEKLTSNAPRAFSYSSSVCQGW